MQFTSNNFNAPKISVALHESLETWGKKKKSLWNMVWNNIFFSLSAYGKKILCFVYDFPLLNETFFLLTFF